MDKHILPTLAALAVASVFTAAPATAQTPVAAELRGSYGIPVGDFADGDAEGDIGFGADLFVHLTPTVAAYGGWGRERFTCESCDDDDGVRSEGFDGGIQFTLAPGTPVELLLRGGLVYHKVETEVGLVSVESDYGLGVQAIAAVALALGPRASLVPAVRFQTLDPSIEVAGEDVSTEGRMSFLALQLGLRVGH
jgi:hypothetical protein